jgi:hypothetical protein
MKRIHFLLPVLLVATLAGCSSDDNNEPDPGETSKYKEDGYVLSAASQSTGGLSFYVGQYDTEPKGDVDLTKKSAYPTFNVRANYKNYIYAPAPSDDKKFSKLAIDKTSGALVEVASIPLLTFLSAVNIISDELGIYSTYEDRGVYFFNPKTMEKIAQVDMSKAKGFPDNEVNIYTDFIYRPQDNKIFATLHTNSRKTGAFYDSQNIYLEVIDVNTRKWEKTVVYEQATYPISRGLENDLVDEQGNIYVVTQGQYGLDGQLGPNAAKRSKPQILKIPAGSTEFDKTYSFNPVVAVGLPNLMFQLLLGTIYDANGIAYACISGQQDPPRLLELIGKLAANTITAAEYTELQSLAFYGANQRWAKLDLKAQTDTVIADIPLTAGFA